MREVQIFTDTLQTLVNEHDIKDPIFLKLDTQGSELDIMKGAEDLFDSGQIVLVESEASLLRETFYEKATRLPELSQFMESKGFDLIDLKIIKSRANIKRSEGVLQECDAIFVMGFERTLRSKLEVRLAVFYAYLLLRQSDLAQRLLSIDEELLKRVREALTSKELELLIKRFRSIS
jgi:hypothetical protein